jgi:hypothetical protein
MRIHQLIEEIKHHNVPSRKTAYEIYKLLDNNNGLFQEKLEKEYLEGITNSFESLSNSHPLVYDTPVFKREFEQHYQSLLYKFERII